jgi:hypothetical protein
MRRKRGIQLSRFVPWGPDLAMAFGRPIGCLLLEGSFTRFSNAALAKFAWVRIFSTRSGHHFRFAAKISDLTW